MQRFSFSAMTNVTNPSIVNCLINTAVTAGKKKGKVVGYVRILVSYNELYRKASIIGLSFCYKTHILIHAQTGIL